MQYNLNQFQGVNKRNLWPLLINGIRSVTANSFKLRINFQRKHLTSFVNSVIRFEVAKGLSRYIYIVYALTESVIILSNNIIGGIWKSNTKYCNKKDIINSSFIKLNQFNKYLIIENYCNRHCNLLQIKQTNSN